MAPADSREVEEETPLLDAGARDGKTARGLCVCVRMSVCTATESERHARALAESARERGTPCRGKMYLGCVATTRRTRECASRTPLPLAALAVVTFLATSPIRS